MNITIHSQQPSKKEPGKRRAYIAWLFFKSMAEAEGTTLVSIFHSPNNWGRPVNHQGRTYEPGCWYAKYANGEEDYAKADEIVRWHKETAHAS